MSLQEKIDNVLQQEVSRRQFLLMVIMAAIALIGIDRFVKVLDLPKREIGFGTGPYGGSKDMNKQA